MRTLAFALAAVSLSSAAVLAADAVTTRIETRPYYGAIVTVEQGVRVWRPLPPHDRIIINPEGKAAVSIELKDRNGNGHGASSSGSSDNGNGNGN